MTRRRADPRRADRGAPGAAAEPSSGRVARHHRAAAALPEGAGAAAAPRPPRTEDRPLARPPPRPQEEPPIRDAAAWPALVPVLALVALGVVFVAAPDLGAAIFGLPAPEGGGVAWIAVVGLRDLAFGGYVFALALFSTRRVVGLVLGMTVLIPLGDVLLLLAARGFSSPGHLLLHLASGGVMAAAAAWMLRRA